VVVLLVVAQVLFVRPLINIFISSLNSDYIVSAFTILLISGFISGLIE
jgi:hypothetical protein